MKDKPRYVEARKTAGGGVQYVWNPPSAFKADGRFRFVVLGADKEKSFTEAISLNSQLDQARPNLRKGSTTDRVTVEELIRQYKASTYFQVRKPLTKKGYEVGMRHLSRLVLDNGVQVGDLFIRDIRPRQADAIYAALLAKHGKAAAGGCMRLTKRMFDIAYKWEMIEDNPFRVVEVPKTDKRRVTWTHAQVVKFIKTAQEMDRASIGLIAFLTYSLGQRLSDMIRLRWDDVAPDCSWIKYVQHKTTTEIHVPCWPWLQKVLQDLPHRTGYVARPEAGRKGDDAHWTDNSFSQCARRIMSKAGLPGHLWVRDLRRTALTETGTAGATDEELMAMSGHANREQLPTYVIRNAVMAASAVRKRQESIHEALTEAQSSVTPVE